MPRINSKQKGNRVELEIVKILEKRFGEGKFRRTPQSGSLVGGINKKKSENLDISQIDTLSSDIICPPTFRFVIEVKGRKEASFWDLFNESAELKQWLEQVETDASFVKKESMLIIKYNRKPLIVYTRTCINKICKFTVMPTFWYCHLLEDLLKLPDSFWIE